MENGKPGTNETKVSKTAEGVDAYAVVRLTTDVSKLTANERRMIPLLIAAAKQMDQAFWIQAYGDKNALLASLNDPRIRRLAEINYGPWDRLKDQRPFVSDVGPKPAGANFYPADMTKEEFERYLSYQDPATAGLFRSPYTMIRRDEMGQLEAIPYSRFFMAHILAAGHNMTKAAEYAEDEDFRAYLIHRADAMVSDDYRVSDLAWMDMKNNTIDLVIGPIETYEDGLFGYKAAFEAFVLVKDKAWSERLARYTTMLPDLQRALPVEETYKKEAPGSDSDLNAYDVIYYAGDCNAGPKTIAINLPNDEQVQLQKGTRRLQLKNAMRAKFDKILVPVADLLMAEDQRKHITFDAFFEDTMFHEVAHGLGIKNTINGRGMVREALKEQHSALEEGKADILGLFMITTLHEKGELPGADLMDHYATFMAGIFRSVRFGAASAHGRANIVRFNFFAERGAFTRDARTGRYRVNKERMRAAVEELAARILRLQGDGDYEGAKRWMDEAGTMPATLRADLERVNSLGIPVDVVFEQGVEVLGL